MNKLHWSHLSMFTRCGEQFRRRYIEGEVIPPAIAMITGSSVHEAADINLSHKLENGTPADKEECIQKARDVVDAHFRNSNVFFSPEEKAAKSKDAWRDDTVDTSVTLTDLHYEEVAPTITPTEVERYWEIDIKGWDFSLAGTLDVREVSGDVSIIRDLKTSARKWSQSKVNNTDQLTTYALPLYVLDGISPDDIQLFIDCLTKTKTPKAHSLQTSRTAEDLQTLLRRFQALHESVSKGVFMPCDRADWVCSPKFCGYYDSCPYVKGKVQFSLS